MSHQPSQESAGGASPADPTTSNVHPRMSRWWLKSLINASLFLGAGTLLIVLVGVGQRVGWLAKGGAAGTVSTHAASPGAAYICPMMCTPTRQSEPGNCPVCGMALAPVAGGTAGSLDKYAVQLEPAARRVANIKTETVQAISIERSLRTIGSIAFDESRRATISA